jgi:peptidoglycan/LPS O-acetylase OafA/YrhL
VTSAKREGNVQVGELAHPRPQSGRLAAADGFRALAAIAIVTGHLVMFSSLTMQGRAVIVALLTSFGICGVDCFFVLSGFLLSRPYVEALIDPDRPLPSARDFATRRFFRIYPLYALAVVLSAIAPMLHRHQPLPLRYLATHLTFLHGFSIHYVNAIQDGPLWTMAVDVQFYLALPLVAAALAYALRDHDRTTRIRALVATLVTVTVAGLALRTFAYTHIPLTMHSFAAAAVYARNALGMASAFAFGAGIALLRATTPPPSRLVGAASIAVGILIGLALAPTGLDTSSLVPVQVSYDFFAALAVAFALYGASAGQRCARRTAPAAAEAKPRRRIGAGSVISFVALVSYPFYLFHWPVLMAAVDVVGARLASHSGSAEYALAIVGITLIATVVVALAAQVFVDRVVGALRERYAAARRLAPVHALEVVSGELLPAELVAPEIAAERA